MEQLTIEQSLKETLQKGALAVFPTEFIARSWMCRILCHQIPILWEDCVLSWANFRDQYCTEAAGQPITPLLRHIFCATLLEQNRHQQLFTFIIPSSQRNSAEIYLPRVAHIVSTLPTLIARAQECQPSHALLRDLHTLYHRYQQLLNQHALYEPRWHPVTPQLPVGATLYFPETIPDYSEYALQLRARKDILLYHSPPLQPVAWSTHPSVRYEIESVTSALAMHLKAGVDPADIAVSVADLATYQELILSTMRTHAIPYTLHVSQPLVHCAPYQLLEGVARLSQFNYHYQIAQALFENPAIPWKKEINIPTILQRAINYRKLYWSLPADVRDACEALSAASSAAALQSGYYSFSQLFLNSAEWEPPHAIALERTESLLATMVYYEQQYRLPIRYPLNMLLSRLQEQSYYHTPVDEAVAICEYPDSAGAAVQYHYVINMTHQAAQCTRRQWEMFPDQLRALLNASEQDLTAKIIGLYSHSGSQVFFSFSELNQEGAATPHPIFYQHSTVTPTSELAQKNVSRHSIDESMSSIPMQLERSTTTKNDERIPPYVQQGARYRLAIMGSSPVADAPNGKSHLTKDETRDISTLFIDADDPDRILISFNKIIQFLHCVRGLLVRHEIGRDSLGRYIDIDDYQYQGRLAHAILTATLSKWSAAHQAPLALDQLSVLEHYLNDEIVAQTKECLKIMRVTYRKKFQRQFTELLKALIDHYSGWHILATEKNYRYAPADTRYTLTGRVDLILIDTDQKQQAIIDFKKAKNAYRTHNEERFMQLAFYATLIERDTLPVVSASYFFTEDAVRPLQIGIPDDTDQSLPSLSMEREKLDLVLEDYIRFIAQGTASITAAPSCSDCWYPGICRQEFYGE